MIKKKKILIIAAHPDDEIIGCGGTISKYSKAGMKVKTVILTKGISSRQENRGKPSMKTLKLQNKLNNSALMANKSIGVKNVKFYNLPDNEFDKNSLLSLVKIIESEIKIYKPDIIFTHYLYDLNIDHQYVSKAVVTAARPDINNGVSQIVFFEVNSSTDFQINSNNMQFQPNMFVDISKNLDRKKRALKFYKSEMRKYPHSRSIKAIINRNISVGNSVGLKAAEAFQIVRKIEK